MQIPTRIPNLKVKSGSYFFLSLTCPCLQARKLEVEDRQWGSILGALTGGAGGAALGNALGSAAGRNIFFNFPSLSLFQVLLLEVMATLQELEELLLELLVVEVLEQQLAMPWKTLFQVDRYGSCEPCE